ncbi:MAG: hypothetical protein J0M33_14495 [Anaerolineae bacterium]|nr:hypothetical protein [Anaerolineae bacterium]
MNFLTVAASRLPANRPSSLAGGGILSCSRRQRRKLALGSRLPAVKLVAHVAHQRRPPAFPPAMSVGISKRQL